MSPPAPCLVARVIAVKDADEAVGIANDTEYGLVAAIQTGSAERGLEIADQLGQVQPVAVGGLATTGPPLPVLESAGDGRAGRTA
jgi:acyl-CoA reductase-like NAD-dependent aldehyde dehydrogenase